MASILSSADFQIGEYVIASFNTAMDVSANLDLACESTEKQVLSNLFGAVMYLDFIKNKSDAKYQTLIDGYKVGLYFEPYDSENPKVYFGLKDLLKYFTYFNYLEAQSTFNTIVGEIAPTQENGTQAYNDAKMLKAYNLGVIEFSRAIDFINWSNQSAVVYDNFEPSEMGRINVFGI